jgi:hemerythrin
MKYKEWSSDFEIGIGAIDQDHQTLFANIKQLGEHISQDRGPGRIEATINALSLYVDEHFKREERFMITAGYPDYEAHKKEHESFQDAVFSLRDFFKQHPDDIDAQKIINFLEDWLLHHILQVDKQYQPYLLGKKQGDPAITKKFQNGEMQKTIQLSCPANLERHVSHFISLISESSEEGKLIDQAVEKIANIRRIRREQKAKALFGK